MQSLAENLEPSVPAEEIAAAETAEVKEPPVVEEKKEEVQPEKLVRLEALHEERGKRKELAKQVEQLRRQQEQERAVLNDRLQQLYAMQQPQPQIDPNDPIAVHDHALRSQQQQLAEIQQNQQWIHAQRQQQEQEGQLVNWARMQALEYSKEKPDFNDAYKHVANQRAAMIAASGVAPEEAMQRLRNDELWFYYEAQRQGKDPAEALYQLAQSMGYRGKGGEQKMQTLQKGVEASKSLGSGGAVSGNPTPEQIANMSDDEFAEFKAGLGKKNKRMSDAL